MRIAFATTDDSRDRDEDLGLLVHEAHERGHEAELPAWDDPDVDWHAFDISVVRSCWNYVDNRDAFMTWADSVPRLFNDAAVLTWNTDKLYLRELARAGIAIVPTLWNPGDATAVEDICGERASADGEWVTKPCVLADARDTHRCPDLASAIEHSLRLQGQGHMTLVQPYMDSVDTEGETSLIFIAGRYSHAIRKGAVLTPNNVPGPPDRPGRITARAPTASQHELASTALSAVGQILGRTTDLLYARVDVITAGDGSDRVIELELTEPSLFLPFSDDGAARMIDAIAERL